LNKRCKQLTKNLPMQPGKCYVIYAADDLDQNYWLADLHRLKRALIACPVVEDYYQEHILLTYLAAAWWEV